jgi:arsenite methyltransferase
LSQQPGGYPGERRSGIDPWRSQDHSGNDPVATRRNAEAAGVGDRIELCNADMTALPFPEAIFDIVTSALAVHNVPTAEGRGRALGEATRVPRAGGGLLLADLRHINEYRRQLGPTPVAQSLGPEYWYGGPWAATILITATKS